MTGVVLARQRLSAVLDSELVWYHNSDGGNLSVLLIGRHCCIQLLTAQFLLKAQSLCPKHSWEPTGEAGEIAEVKFSRKSLW